jgi:hypothetical protein
MKRINFLAVLMALTGVVACKEKKEPYPINVPFTEYSLAKAGCQWTNLKSDKVIIVNSQSELDSCIICTDVSYPQISFAENTLLLAKGGTTNGVREIICTVSKDSEQDYTLNVAVHLDITLVAQGWYIFILIPKISNQSNITLDVKQTHN